MKGQIFTLDAVLGSLFLLAAIYFVSLVLYYTTTLSSEEMLYRRLEVTARKAVDTLLLGEGAWACYVERFRVPGCVVEGTYPSQKELFFVNDVVCELSGSASLAKLMGCTATPPPDAKVTYTVEFNVCATTSSPDACVQKTLRLTIWSG